MARSQHCYGTFTVADPRAGDRYVSIRCLTHSSIQRLHIRGILQPISGQAFPVSVQHDADASFYDSSAVSITAKPGTAVALARRLAPGSDSGFGCHKISVETIFFNNSAPANCSSVNRKCECTIRLPLPIPLRILSSVTFQRSFTAFLTSHTVFL